MSEFVRIEKSEIDRLQEIAGTLSQFDAEQVKADIAEVKRFHEESMKNFGRPGFLYASKADYEDKREKAEHLFKFFDAADKMNVGVIEDMQKASPEWYTQKANFNTGTDAQGGYLVPDFWANEIQQATDKYGFAARIARIYPMSAQKVNLTNGSDCTGYEVSETGSPTTTDSTNFFANVPLEAKRFAAGYIVSRVQLRDALPAFEAYLAERLGQGMAKRIDQTFFKGATGSSNHFDGVTVVSGTNTEYLGGAIGSTKTAFSNVSWADMVRLETAVADGVLDNAIYVIPRSIYKFLRLEVDEQSRPIWNYDRPADYAKLVGLDALGRSVYPGVGGGYPVVVVPDSLFPTTGTSTACGVFGDFSQFAYYGVREGMTMEVFNERWNGVDIAGHSRAIEVQASIGIAFNDPAGFAVLKTAAS